MKHLVALTLTLTCALSSFAQINLCPKNDADWTTKLLATADFNLPIIKVERMMTRELVKSIKVPELILGMLSLDDKYYIGFSNSNIYRINIQTEKIESFPFSKKGTLPSGEAYEWKYQFTQMDGLYLYKYSKKKELPLILYKANFDSKSVEMVWETGLPISKNTELGMIPTTDYWTYADDQGNAVVFDMRSKKKVMEKQFPVPAAFLDQASSRLDIDLKASYKGVTSWRCNQICYTLINHQSKQSYIGVYDLNTKETIVSHLANGHVVEWVSNKKSYWAVLKYNEKSTDLTVYNDNDFNDVRFQFKSLKKGTGTFKMQYNDNRTMLSTLTVTYAAGTTETYDWATKKLLKTEKAKAEVIDF